MQPAFERLLRMDMFPLAPRTTALFGMLALLTFSSGAIAYREIGQIRAGQELAIVLDERHGTLTELDSLVGQQNTALLSFLVTGDDRHTAAFAASVAAAEPRIARLRELLARTPEDLQRLERALQILEQWRTGYAQRQLDLMTRFATVNVARALQITGEPAALLAQASEELGELIRIGEAEKERLDAALRADLFWIMVALAVATTLSLLVAIIAGWWMRRFLFSPITAITHVLDRLRAGELAVAVPEIDRRDEIGVIARAVASFGESLRDRARLEAEAREAAAAAAARAARVADLQARLGQVVDAALMGDFSSRIDHRYEDRDLQELADRVDLLVGGVQAELRDLMAVNAALADADLTRRLSGERQGDFARLQDDTNRMIENLTSLVLELETVASDVRATVTEISTGADELAARTDQQASSLEETAATTEELTASVTQNSEHSRQANGLAQEARELAEKGREIAGEAVAAMIRSEQASARMSDITTIIQQIAKQTRSLAINAAVQAKRAGEEGRGFAVVAQEVRMLADRSNDAARDINKLIANNTQQLGECVELVKRAGKMLESIVITAQRVESTVHEIASANAQQAHSIKEMSLATVHLDGMTQKNAALAEQSARGARALAGRVRDLLDRVAVFRVDPSLRPEEQRHPAPARMPVATALPARVPARGQAAPPVLPHAPLAAAALAGGESWSEF
jgi:methyl-accepting chemotaxis protein